MAVKEKAENGILETIKTIVYALLIAGVFRTLFFQPFWIPSGSMKETLLIGDFLFVNKMAYGFSYASCPSIPIIGLDAKKLCGFIGGNNKRFQLVILSVVMLLFSGTQFLVLTTSNVWSVCQVTRSR